MGRLTLLVFLLFSAPLYAGEHILNPSFGATDWSQNTGHRANGSTLSFDNDASITHGFKYLYRFDNGLAIGGGFTGYTKDVTTTALAHEASVGTFVGVVQYYFNNTGTASPFIGFGLGGTGIAFDGGSLDGDSSGGANVQLNAGMLFKFSEMFGMQVEYQYNTFDVDESIHNTITDIETYSHSVLVGLTIHL